MTIIIIIIILAVVQGFFSGSEIALITLRRSRTTEVVKKFGRRGQIIQQLQSKPEIFIATTQIGISVFTIVASAFAGNKLEDKLAPVFKAVPLSFISDHATAISFVIIVIILAYINLVVGELVPKSLALRYPETFSLWAAYPLYAISQISRPIIRFITVSSNILLRPFRDSTSFMEAKLSEEEIRGVLDEGRQAGAIERQEHEILENVFELSEVEVGKVMTPGNKMVALDLDESLDKNLTKVIESEYTRVPVYKGTLDNVLGVLNTKDLLPYLGRSVQEIDLQKLLIPALFVPNSQKIGAALQTFQRRKTHMALVTDEHGQVDGLVTLEDILEELVGEISDESDEISAPVVKHSEDSYVVEGAMPIVDFNRHFKAGLPEDESFAAISGLILDRLGRFPRDQDLIVEYGFEFRILEKTPRAIKKVLVKKIDSKQVDN